MSEERLFTDEELRHLGNRTLDELIARLESGDAKTAGQLAHRMYAEFLAMHDLYRDWVTHLLSFIGRRHGEDEVAEALEESVGAYTLRLGRRYIGKEVKRKVEILAAGLRGHLHPFEVVEEDDRIVINAGLCGSGGRLVRDGRYEGPDGYLKLKGPREMTFGRDEWPVYCAHCHFQNVVPGEPGGEPLFQTEAAEKPGEEPCRIVIPKK